MTHDLGQVVRIEGVENVEEVISGRALVFWVLVGEVLREGLVVLQVGPQMLDADFIIMGYGNLLYLVLLHQLLAVGEDIFQEVLRDDLLLR